MKVIRVENQVEGAKVALEILKEKLAQGAKTLGLATGSSPIEFYKQIIASNLDLSELTSVNLDEYVGLSEDNPQSYRYFMNEQLFNKKPFKESFLPNGAIKSWLIIQWICKFWELVPMGILALMSQELVLIALSILSIWSSQLSKRMLASLRR